MLESMIEKAVERAIAKLLGVEAAPQKPEEKPLRPVLVTTEHRGVFFGYASEFGKTMRLQDAQLAVYWNCETHGFEGLAHWGPSDQCRIGPPATAEMLTEVTGVFAVTEEAAARWKAQPWRK